MRHVRRNSASVVIQLFYNCKVFIFDCQSIRPPKMLCLNYLTFLHGSKVTQLHTSVKRRVGESIGLLCHRLMALPVLPHKHI